MAPAFDQIVDRFVLASGEFERKLETVRDEQWCCPTPCEAWNVRQLVNHMTRGNLNYLLLLRGGTRAEFLRQRDADALGEDPVGAYRRSVRECAESFNRPGALERRLDYPLGAVMGQQAIAVRTVDSLVHTWDLARALNADETLDSSLLAWAEEHLHEIYAGLTETPVSADTSHRFFAPPTETGDGSRQSRLLALMGRKPGATGAGARVR